LISNQSHHAQFNQTTIIMHCRSKQKTSVNVGELLSSRGDDWVEDTENKAATVIKERLIDLIRTTGCKHAENEFNKWVNTFCETTYFCLYDSCCWIISNRFG
jgi:hypothetical protein